MAPRDYSIYIRTVDSRIICTVDIKICSIQRKIYYQHWQAQDKNLQCITFKVVMQEFWLQLGLKFYLFFYENKFKKLRFQLKFDGIKISFSQNAFPILWLLRFSSCEAINNLLRFFWVDIYYYYNIFCVLATFIERFNSSRCCNWGENMW